MHLAFRHGKPARSESLNKHHAVVFHRDDPARVSSGAPLREGVESAGRQAGKRDGSCRVTRALREIALCMRERDDAADSVAVPI